MVMYKYGYVQIWLCTNFVQKSIKCDKFCTEVFRMKKDLDKILGSIEPKFFHFKILYL